MRRPSLVALICLVALAVPGCVTQTPSSPPPATSATVSTFELERAPAGLGCDAIGVVYRHVTFRIDPDADVIVTGLTDTGISLRTFWSAGFEGVAGAGVQPVVLDAGGAVVVTDGEELPIPEARWPDLHGYVVCPTPDALYILAADPA